MFFIDNSLDTTTRFDMIKFFNFDVDNIDCLTSFMMRALKILPKIGTYTIKEEEYRPDLLSYKLYNDTQFWWLLMWYNSILSIKDLKSGLSIDYPSKNNLEDLYLSATNYSKVLQ